MHARERVAEGYTALKCTPFPESLVFKDGFVELPAGPGLDIEISEEGLEANTATDWRLRNMCRDPDDHSYI